MDVLKTADCCSIRFCPSVAVIPRKWRFLLLVGSLVSVISSPSAADGFRRKLPSLRTADPVADSQSEQFPRRFPREALFLQRSSVKKQAQPAKKTSAPKSPAGKLVSLKPHDEDYVPASIGSVSLDIAQSPQSDDPDFRMIRYTETDVPAYDPQPISLTRMDAMWVDQRLFGPVAPFCFLPTFFEDDGLSRFGSSCGDHIQPFVSAARFTISVPLLPYQIQRRRPYQAVFPDYCPPPPTLRGKIRRCVSKFDAKALAVEAGAIALSFVLIP